ncbi:PREDICTED: kinesin heavy chain-like [Amphimedon queenslandica]|uniref:Uncharacterized protein n=1 Tax=Amphimedon queenslandica TaxID=400682 RepID=A0A1X7V585_AMPQE|nr:PREDICTED: kinesin heavy chain-like [Amphimedon queenslandica]|eukprot:XP_011403151.1 PREDICTED: kinesin heavy chain-like [Amphimedon queenslandica]
METEHSSMESFEAVGENTGEESYTIIDRNKLDKDLEDETGSDWDLAQSLQPSLISIKDSEKMRKSSQSEDEIENEKSDISSPPFSLVTVPQDGGEALPPSKMETKRYASSSLEKTSYNSMSQSVMEEKEEHISQSRARSLQKNNKDLLMQNKKLSRMLTQEKQKLEELLRSKDKEIAVLVTKLCELQDTNDSLNDNLEVLNTEVRNLKIALQVKAEALAARTEEVEYLNNENERMKRNLDEYLRDIEKLKEEIMKNKRRENLREASSTATSSSRSSEQHSRKPREHHHHSSSSSQRRERSRDQPQGEDHSRELARQRGSGAIRDSRPERLDEPNISSRAYESLKKASAISVCPVCGEERPYEKAMDMTNHVEECLRKKGYA